MIVSHDREKMLHALIYFIGATKHAHTLKLFKLLNFLDFEHFRQTGFTVTGLEYSALPKGPVPMELWRELKNGVRADFAKAITVVVEKDSVTDEVARRDLKPRVGFNPKLFSKRELAIMDRLVEFFHDTKGDDMSEFSHYRKMPWRKVFKNGEGENKSIPFELAFESDPIVHDKPTIDPQEYDYRRTLLKGIG